MARRNLRALYRFARHELAYRRNAGDVLGDEITVEDVVDAVMLRAWTEFAADPKRRRSAGWWVRLATEWLDAETTRLGAERETTRHFEEDVPETAPAEEVTTLGEEILYFYQPDEDLKLEDLVPDLEIEDPELMAESDEVRDRVRAALAEMPAAWRRALLLHLTEDLGPAELADALGKPKDEIASILGQARERIRGHLAAGGYKLESLPV
jgi:RNA polymerase sigma factor (sigma-70 family)